METNINKKKSGLGRGLHALLEDAREDLKAENQFVNQEVVLRFTDIPLVQIERNPGQPRVEFDEELLDELAESIKIHGIIQPVTVRKLAKNRYQLISGERRTRAAIKAGIEQIPAYIRDVNDQQTLEMALIENIQREDLNAMEIANSYQRLIEECSLNQEDLSKRVGKKRSTVTNYLRLLKLPTELQIALRANLISMGHARALLPVDNVEVQKTLLEDILEQDMSVRQIEKLVREVIDNKGQIPVTKTDEAVSKENQVVKEKSRTDYNHLLWEEKLSDVLKRKVQIRIKKDGKGEIVLPFNDETDIQQFLKVVSTK